MNSAIIQQAVEVLNRALAADPEAVRRLFELRVPCNKDLADDPTVQVRSEDGGATVGVLGIINGILGLQSDGATGYVASENDLVCPDHGALKEDKGLKYLEPCPVEGCTKKLLIGPIQKFTDITLPIGPTGEYPMGKLNADDEGELGIAIGTKRDNVLVSFGKAVSWIGMKPQDARQLAVYLMDRANDADESEPILRVSGDMTCKVCGDVYRNHPHDMKQLSYDNQPFLRVRCDGRRLKL